jgi:glycine hydroxymethyltransferase
LILTNNEDLAKKFDKAVFPGTQGGPLMHVIAGKAVNFAEDAKPEFREYAQQIVTNAKALASALMERGYHVVSNGTDNHLLLVDLRPTAPDTTGKQASLWLEQAGIITNKNTVPKDDRSPFQCSGLRLGTPALTTRGLKEEDMATVAELLDRAVKSEGDDATLQQVRSEVVELCKQFAMPH